MADKLKESPFIILQLGSDATLGDVKKQYRALTLLNHPDKNPRPDANAIPIKIREAYEALNTEQQLSAAKRSAKVNDYWKPVEKKPAEKKQASDSSYTKFYKMMQKQNINKGPYGQDINKGPQVPPAAKSAAKENVNSPPNAKRPSATSQAGPQKPTDQKNNTQQKPRQKSATEIFLEKYKNAQKAGDRKNADSAQENNHERPRQKSATEIFLEKYKNAQKAGDRKNADSAQENNHERPRPGRR